MKIERISTVLMFVLLFQTIGSGQPNENSLQPRLVVGIVIDEMRFDYLYRYYPQYSEKGFKRLLREGMNFTFARLNYMPTYTGPGHASIYTGTTPCYHGIISNDWYNRPAKEIVYCVRDTGFATVGAGDDAGKVSPRNLLSTTMTDQLRMSNNGLSKVYSVSLKDRAAVLPGGHMANAAYWYDGTTGRFISSSYYMKALPTWVDRFNERKLPLSLMNSDWTLESGRDYTSSQPDEGYSELDTFKEGKTIFPHKVSGLPDSAKLELITFTPYGNELLNVFFTELLKNEKPGQGKYCDFVAVSFSAADYIAHAYGPNSVEVMDAYLKLDREIGRLLDVLDLTVGKGNYLLFLTADHAGKPNGAYLRANGIREGLVSPVDIHNKLEVYCRTNFGAPGIIEKIQDNQIYLNYMVLDSIKISVTDVTESIAVFMRNNLSFIGTVMTRQKILDRTPERSREAFILNGFNPERSGDVTFSLAPNFLIAESWPKGTSHESNFDYDTHVPLIFFGWHIKSGESRDEVFIEDIAPTVSSLIHIQEPDATLGIPVIR
jgi:predicted AlkP superfamily pyrophosphatase or phosphodiesterase